MGVEAHPQPGALARLFHAYSSLARRRSLACAAVFLLTLGLRFGLMHWFPVPNPVIHDEFSYLLAADTYAHGRLANPTPPFWQHFETFHELQQPAYASKYPVLQGMALALGQKVLGAPWLGVALTSAMMCAAVCWMLQSWIAPEWALAGALLFLLRIGVLSYWMNSYEGGALTALGGSLALGAVGRISKTQERASQLRQAAIWGLGLAVLMHTRPYDAAMLALASGLLFLWLWHKQGADWSTAFVRVGLPVMGVLAISVAALAYIDLRVTGSAFEMPYLVWDRQYLGVTMFWVMPLRAEPVYHHAVMRDFLNSFPVDQWHESRAEPITRFVARAGILLTFFFGAWPLALILLLWPFALKTTEERAGAVLAGMGLASVAPLAAVLPHYAAAFAPAFLLRYMQSLSRLARWRGALGAVLAASAIALFVLSGRDSFSAALADRAAHFGADRAALQRHLEELPGKQLVLVRYAPGHNGENEWVFNAADIEGSKVIWAREMGPDEDRPFVDYFHDRQAWLLEADRTPPSLTPYSSDEQNRKEARR